MHFSFDVAHVRRGVFSGLLVGAASAALAMPPNALDRDPQRQARALFALEDPQALGDTSLTSSPAAIRERVVRIDMEAFNPARRGVALPLLGGKQYVADRRELEIRDLDDYTWRGSIQLEDGRQGDATFTVLHGAVAGVINTPEGDSYELRAIAGGKHLLTELAPNLFRECADPREPLSYELAQQVAGEPVAVADSDGTIDIMVLYTDDTRAAAGGTSAIEATVQSAVDLANTAYANSGITMRMRLVYKGEYAYTETGSAVSDLTALRNDAAVAALRDQYKADLVSFVVESCDYCGIGYLMSSLSTGFAPNAMNVVARSCAAANLTLAHESGHNMGCEHDPANAGGTSMFAYNRGHYVDGVFRTVMSYNSQCASGCTRVPYFSNPAVSYSGFPTGIASQRDNHLVLNNVAATVANFKQQATGGGSNGGGGVTPQVPAAPSGLRLVLAGAASLQVSWNDNASDETGFKVYKWASGKWVLVKTLGANLTGTTVTGLGRRKRVSLIVRAYNAVGQSAVSNQITAKTK